MVNSNSNFKYRVSKFLIRFCIFCAFVTVGMVVIVEIEKTGNEEKQRKSKLLSDFQSNMTLKYNFTGKEFELLATLFTTPSHLLLNSGHMVGDSGLLFNLLLP